MTSTVHLEIPASGAYLAVARAAATGLAAQLHFTYEEIDDLRIAVDEAVTALLEGGNGSKVPLLFEVEGGQVSMTSSVKAGAADQLDADRLELSTQILAAVCDDHDLEVVDGSVRVRICRRAGAR